jgi:hypothetical protein
LGSTSASTRSCSGSARSCSPSSAAFSLVAYPILWIFVPRDDGAGNPEPLAIWRMLGGREASRPASGRTALIVAGGVAAIVAAIAI